MTTRVKGSSASRRALLIEQTRQCLRSANDHQGRLWSRMPHLDLRVSRKSLARGLAIWGTILDTIERSGIVITLEEGKTIALVDGERLQITVRERQIKAKHEPTAKELVDKARYPSLYSGDRWDLLPTGQFVFVLEDGLLWGARTQWIEGLRHRIEDHLGSIAQGLRAAAAAKSAHRIELDEKRHAFEDEARREAVFASGTNAQRKHLLHQVVKEVRVHGRNSVEVTYFVPQPGPGGSPVMTQPHMAPRAAQCTNRFSAHGMAVFQVFHNLRPEPPWTETVRSRRPPRLDSPLRAATWRDELARGVVPSRADLARREGLSRARINQVLGRPLLRQANPFAAPTVQVRPS
jgi:hypothetical protein